MTCCVDASATVPWIIAHPLRQAVSPFWLKAIGDGSRIAAPVLIYSEVTTALRRLASARVISHEDAVLALGRMLVLPLASRHGAALYQRALELAQALELSKAYDTQYLAVAQLEGCELVTADATLHGHARKLGIRARLLRGV